MVFEFGDSFEVDGVFVLEGLEFEVGAGFALRDFEDLVFEGLNLLTGVENGLLFVFDFFVEVLDLSFVFGPQVFKLLDDV